MRGGADEGESMRGGGVDEGGVDEGEPMRGSR